VVLVQVQGNATGEGGCWWESEVNSHRTIKYVSSAQELAGSINQQYEEKHYEVYELEF
jgi:hypothetical protein